MPSLRSFIRGLLRPVIRVAPIAVRPGDDVILCVRDWPASEDIAAFLNALQPQFPGCRLHLIMGVDSVQVDRQHRGGKGESPTDDGRQQPGCTLADLAADAAQAAPNMAKQGNVLVLRKLSGTGVVAVSVPVIPAKSAEGGGHA